MILPLLALAALQEPVPDLEARLYAASITAAEALLRLNETDLAQTWLQQAPAAQRGWEWRYLDARADRSAAAFAPHDATVTDLAHDPTGRWLASTAGDGSVHVIDVRSRTLAHVLAGHTAAAWSPQFSPDGALLATVSSDGTLRVWDVASGAVQNVFTGVGEGVAACAWAPDGRHLAACSWTRSPERGVRGTLGVWDLEVEERVVDLEHGIKPIAALAYSRDGALLFAGTWDSDVAVFDTATWSEPRRLLPDGERYRAVRDLDVSPDGRHLVVAYADGVARLWDLATERQVRAFDTGTHETSNELNDVVFLPDGTRLATVGADQTVRLWDVASGALLTILHGHTRPVQSVVASPDGRTLFSAGVDRALRAWDLEAVGPGRTTWALRDVSYSLALDPGSRRAVIAGWEGWVQVVDRETGAILRAWQGHETSGVGADWSADGRWLATTGNDGRVVLWDAESGALVHELESVGGQIFDVAFDPSSTRVAARGADGEVCVWSIPDGVQVASLQDGAASAGEVLWTADRLVSAHADGVVRVWDVAGEQLVHRLAMSSAQSATLALHPDGRLLTGRGRDVRLWDLATGTEERRLPEPQGSVNSLAISPDGTRVAAALSNNSLEIWRAETGEVLLRFPFTATAYFTRWSADGATVFALPLDGTARVFDAGE